MQRAVLLDRDGVINVDHGYVGRPEEFEFVPGVVDFLRAAQAHGYLLVVITNQSGIARGYFSQEQYFQLEDHMRDRLSAEGIELAGVYFCPHHPQGSVPELAIDCECRKPRPGLIHGAERDLDLDLGQSILVGDKETDIEAGRLAGVGHAFLVRSGTMHSDQSLFSEALSFILATSASEESRSG